MGALNLPVRHRSRAAHPPAALGLPAPGGHRGTASTGSTSAWAGSERSPASTRDSSPSSRPSRRSVARSRPSSRRPSRCPASRSASRSGAEGRGAGPAGRLAGRDERLGAEPIAGAVGTEHVAHREDARRRDPPARGRSGGPSPPPSPRRAPRSRRASARRRGRSSGPGRRALRGPPRASASRRERVRRDGSVRPEHAARPVARDRRPRPRAGPRGAAPGPARRTSRRARAAGRRGRRARTTTIAALGPPIAGGLDREQRPVRGGARVAPTGPGCG